MRGKPVIVRLLDPPLHEVRHDDDDEEEDDDDDDDDDDDEQEDDDDVDEDEDEWMNEQHMNRFKGRETVEAMRAQPVIVRLLDPPLLEVRPDDDDDDEWTRTTHEGLQGQEGLFDLLSMRYDMMNEQQGQGDCWSDAW